MQSLDNTVISSPGQAITDASGNIWAISDGQVTVNGQVDPTTANVIEMAYEGGLVWQKNTQDLWWSKTSPDAFWSPTYGTQTDPIPNQLASADDTVLVAEATGSIFALNHFWTIGNGQVLVDGKPDPTTARVVALVYAGGQVWQQNADGLWWGKSGADGAWSPQYGTTDAPTPETAPGVVTNQVTLSSAATPITDASGNQWAIQNGQVTLNGVADPTTRDVTELAYVGGEIWQENADGLWWRKGVPADGWSPADGTSHSPVPPSSPTPTRIWSSGNGAFENPAGWSPVGVPESGTTAIVNSGTVTVDPGDATGVSFTLGGTAAHVDFHTGTYDIGQLGGTGTIDAAYFEFSPVSISAAGVTLGSGETLALTETQHFATVALRGDSSLGQGSSLVVQQLAVNHTPYATLENDGHMTLDGATFRVGDLTGSGTVSLTNNATMQVQVTSSDTIELQSGHLEIGTGGNPGVAMLFQAPITQFGSDSTITLDNTVATAELFRHFGAGAGELMLYNGETLVAALTISGQDNLYANFTPSGSAFGGSVTISAHDDGHALPFIRQTG